MNGPSNGAVQIFWAGTTVELANLEREQPLSINEVVEEAFYNADAHGWHDKGFPPFPEFIALAHSELSEALEEYRADTPLLYYKGDKPEGIGPELADAVIRIAHYCKIKGINLDQMLKIKMKYNRTRPYRHGGKRI